MKFSPYGNPIPLVVQGKFHLEILTGSSERGVKQGSQTSYFLAFYVNISKMVEILRQKLTITD